MATYVMSDLHGRMDFLKKMLEVIGYCPETDELYILGDVIDRGADSMELLLFVMQEKRIHFLLGNHEFMMLDCLEKAFPNYVAFLNSAEYKRWMRNGGDVTIEQFAQQEEWVQKQVLDWLRERIVVIPELWVEGTCYYLVHAHHGYGRYTHPMRFCELPYDAVHDMVWNRNYQNCITTPEDAALFLETKGTVICGHTPTIYMPGRKRGTGSRIWRGRRGHLINIDCGCADSDEAAVLGCIRLEDMQEFYVDKSGLRR